MMSVDAPVIIFPEWVYHGTVTSTCDSFKRLLINQENPSFWPVDKDFGRGFYTTIDVEQAKRWAMKRADEQDDDALVLKINCRHVNITPDINIRHLVFLGPSLEWSTFILYNRTNSAQKRHQVSDVSFPGTSVHADVITGPMADNDVGAILNRFPKDQIPLHWFYDEITKSKAGLQLVGLDLGNQIVFSNLDMAQQILYLDGAYKFERGKWVYYDRKEL
ncbi:DUF3990 domain-containing protein [Brevibacillus dissolubilis]|uniref:DUF3990 domain-containing protein n=1 Tax=Brevibacillus dissolubilis TaxID=1844116 RepID=UPI001115BCBA|nr:DUF3990 domain-containing protein [Brevibacillus dissolubilis]